MRRGRSHPGVAAAASLALAALLGAGAAVADDPAAHPLVRDVRVEAPPGEDPAALLRLVPAQAERPLDLRTVRRTVQLLYASGRCANVIASTRVETGGVVLVFSCLPRDVVRSIRLVDEEGRTPREEGALRRALALVPGDELWPGRLEEATARVRDALARRGYRAATVRTAIGGGPQRDVEVVITAGIPTRVGSLTLGDALGPVAARILAGLASSPGAVLDLDALDEDVRTVRARLRQERYLRARVGPPVLSVEGTLARIALPVDAGPRFEFRFVGAVSYRASELQAQLGLDAEQVLDATAIDASASRIRDFYLSEGYAGVRVAVAERSTRRSASIVFTIEEGRRYRVGSVRFVGTTRDPGWLRERLGEALLEVGGPPPANPAADAERLVKASGSTPAARSRATADPTDVWNPPAWDRAVARLVELYRDEGYLDATHERTRATLDARAGTVDVELELREGVQTRVARVVLEGTQRVEAAELEKELRIAPGQPLAWAAVEATRTSLLTLYGRRGFAYARVVDAEEIAPDRRTAVVRFRVEEGPQVRVGKIVVNGARRTREDVIRETLTLRPGEVYDPDAASRSQAALLRLGVFRSVALRLAEADLPEETKDVTVDVAERPWRTLAPGAGFSLANGPRVFVELVQPNLFGRALELVARAKVNYPLDTFRPDLAGKPFLDRIEGRGDVGLHDPRVRLFGMQVGARVDAIVERVHRRAYDMGRASTVFGLDIPTGNRVTLSLQYELEFDHIAKSAALGQLTLTRADLERLRFPEGFTTLQSVRPVIAIDFRDNALHPRRGFLASGTVDWVHSIGGSNDSYLWGALQGSDSYTHMLKLSGAVTGYVPVAQSVLAVSFRAGRVIPLDSSSQTIGPKRFYLGGAATMRGYEEDEVIPQDTRAAYAQEVGSCATSISGAGCTVAAQQLAQGQMLVSPGGLAFVLAKVELRIPLRRSVEAGLFADAGNLWVDPSQMTLRELRYNVGFGLRFSSPIGPAVVDLGFNVSPDQRLGERVVAPHFSIGLF